MAPVTTAAGASTAPVDRHVATRYFTGAYRADLSAQDRWRRLTRSARRTSGIVGLVLVLMTLHAIWRHAGTLLVWPLPEPVIETSAGIGMILLVTALIPRIWRHGLELPAAIVVGLATVEVMFLHYSHRWLTLTLIALAVVAVVIGLYLRVRNRPDLRDLADLEPLLDRWTDELALRLLTGSEIPIDHPTAADCSYLLRTYPKLDRIGATRRHYRLGESDTRARINPVGMAAVFLRADTVVTIEGAIDLTTEQVLYRRAHEVPYAEIAALLWTADLVDGPSARPGAGATVGMAAGATPSEIQAGPLVHRRESLELRLRNGRAISLVFRDSRFLAQAGGEAASLEPPARLRALWADVMARRTAAAAAPPLATAAPGAATAAVTA
jgi:hypothetical protein